MRIVLLILLIISLWGTPSSATNSKDIPSFRWQVGEQLTWKVRWSFIRLGTLKMSIEDTVRLNNQKLYRIKLLMDSNPVLIFVNIHNRYECLVDTLFRPVVYMVNENNGGDRNLLLYQFDYKNKMALMQVLDANDTTIVKTQKTIDLEHNLYDGISLTFFARGNANPGKSFKLFTFIDDKTGPLDMFFQDKLETTKISAIKKEFRTIKVQGKFYIKGIAGVTGDYQGWFTADHRRVPLKALMKVFIGNVTVELEKWKNWNYE